MSLNRNSVVDPSCGLIMDCSSCLALVNCIFVIFAGGQQMCINKDEEYSTNFEVEVTVKVPQACSYASSFKLRSDNFGATEDLVNDNNYFGPDLNDFKTRTDLPLSLWLTFIPSLINLDTSSSTFHSEGLLRFDWRGSPLIMASRKNFSFGDPETKEIGDIHIDDLKELFKIPLVTLENEASNQEGILPVLDLFEDLKLETANNSMRMQAPWRFSTTCLLNFTGWPKDSHTCNITLALDFGSQKNLPLFRAVALLTAEKQPNGIFDEWEVTNAWGYEELFKETDSPTNPDPDYLYRAVFVYKVERTNPFVILAVLPLIILTFSASMFIFGPKRLAKKAHLTLLALLINATLLTCFQLTAPLLQNHDSVVITLYHMNFMALWYSFISTGTIILYTHLLSSRLPNVPFFRFIIHRLGFQQPKSLIACWLQLQEKAFLILYLQHSLFLFIHIFLVGWA